MKKVIAAVVLAVVVLIGFFVHENHEKSKQTDLYEEAAVYFEESDYKKAIEYFEQAREYDNFFSGDLKKEIQYYQAEAHMKLEEYEEAISIYNVLIEEDAKEPMNYVLKACCFCDGEKFEEAAQVYNMGYDETGDESFLSLLCNLYVSIEEYEDALKVIEKSSKLKQDEVIKELRFLEVIIYEKQEEYEAAYEKAAAYCESYPEDEKGIKERDFLESRK